MITISHKTTVGELTQETSVQFDAERLPEDIMQRVVKTLCTDELIVLT